MKRVKNIPLYTRKFKTLDSKEEVLLDVNELAKNYDYYQVSGLSVSPDNKKVFMELTLYLEESTL